jgi:peptidyl-dipeptidase Dcp
MKKRFGPLGLSLALVLTVAAPVGEAQDNPLLMPFTTPYQTPPFDRIQTGHYLPAIQEGIRQNQAEIETIVANPAAPTFDNTIAAMDLAGQLLGRVAGIFYSMLGSMDTPEIQEIARQMSPLLSAHSDSVWFNEKLFARVKQVYDRRNELNLSVEQLYLVENTHREFVRRGVLLYEEQKARLRDINRESSLLMLKFHENLLSETNNSFIVIDNKDDLAGLPQSVITMGEETAGGMNLPGKWVFTAQRPSWTPFLQYADVRKHRQALYAAYFMRGNRDNECDNKAIVQKLLTLREERCRLLGYATPAAYLLEDRMAGTPQAVDSFLWSLWPPALQRAKAELAEMQSIMDREKGGEKLKAWDWWYYAEKLRKAKYDLDDTALRPYFTLENVQTGMFELAGRLFGLRFVERKDIPVYHPDVRVFEVKEDEGQLLGILYADFFPRQSKHGGAWSGEFRTSFVQDGERVIPLATLICNSSKPTQDTPPLLSLEEAKVAFHEFGHALNTLLSMSTYRTGYIPQDAVELPSQIMENWVLEPEMLKLYAKHYQTGEVIPASLVDKLKQSELFNQGFEAVEYLAACFLDMAWHQLESAKNVNVNDFEADVMASIGLIPEILPRYHTTYFTHMQGGYQAGYYSYYWAGVLDADAFQAFKEIALFDRHTAASFRKNILEKLGTEDAMTLYRRFRGREPKVEPFLKRSGLM